MQTNHLVLSIRQRFGSNLAGPFIADGFEYEIDVPGALLYAGRPDATLLHNLDSLRGVYAVHFRIILILNGSIGRHALPFGFSLFVGMNIFKASVYSTPPCFICWNTL